MKNKKMISILGVMIIVFGILATTNIVSGADPSQKKISVGAVNCEWNGNLFVCDCLGECKWSKDSGCVNDDDVRVKIPEGFSGSNRPSGCFVGLSNCCPKTASGSGACSSLDSTQCNARKDCVWE
ncbi:hypothetical protein J4474_00390, partial [Candidatus Pacearchaeota archaeon]|nr:hypothetical protein [Candidatus Pacearchaeota archaeon]